MTPMSIRRMQAFTAVEVMVVITVIIILAGVIFPAVRIIRNNVQTGRCAATLRQVWTGASAYASANGGLFLTGENHAGDRWYILIDEYLGVASDANASKQLACPRGLRSQFGKTKKVVMPGELGYSYGFNNLPWYQLGESAAALKNRINIDKVGSPNRMIYFGESAACYEVADSVSDDDPVPAGGNDLGKITKPDNNTYGGVLDGDAKRTLPPSGGLSAKAAHTERSVRVSHRKKANFLFFDGRVALMSPWDTYGIPSGTPLTDPKDLWSR